jgi:hypothetical protein
MRLELPAAATSAAHCGRLLFLTFFKKDSIF